MQEFAVQVTVLKVPPAPQVAVSEPLYPVAQVTGIAVPVVPVIAPFVDLSEFAT